MNKNLIGHKILIDEMVTIDIRIPKIMSATEFNGLFLKYRKILNLSSQIDLPIPNNINQLKKRDYNNIAERNSAIVKDKNNGMETKDIAYKYNLSSKTIGKILINNGIKSFNRDSFWTDELLLKICDFLYPKINNDLDLFNTKIAKELIKEFPQFKLSQILNMKNNHRAKLKRILTDKLENYNKEDFQIKNDPFENIN